MVFSYNGAMAPTRLLRVLVVEDDPGFQDAYRRFFERLHPDEFAASIVPDGEQALDVLRREAVDILVLDWILPGISGASLAKALRASVKTRSLGILMVSARGNASETAFALEAGADDHLAKPFDWKVFLAHLHSLARRQNFDLGARAAKTFPGLRLDFDAERLKLDGRLVRLTPKEMALLKIFVARPGLLHTQAYLWNAAWDHETDNWEHILRVTLSSLRKKLGAKWGAHLKTAPGRGYLFDS